MEIRSGKIKAFTIMETVVTLVITTLLIAFVYQIFSSIIFQFNTYSKQQEMALEYNHLSSLLTKDVGLCQKIEYLGANEIRLIYPEHNIVYDFEKHLTVRSTERSIDTFKVAIKDVEIINLDGDERIKREAIRLKTELMGRSLTIFESKALHLETIINHRFTNVD